MAANEITQTEKKLVCFLYTYLQSTNQIFTLLVNCFISHAITYIYPLHFAVNNHNMHRLSHEEQGDISFITRVTI